MGLLNWKSRARIMDSEKKITLVGALQLIISRVFAGLTRPALKWLIQEGGPLGLQHPNAISFCNVLFVGNICASVVPLLLYGLGNVVDDLKKLSWGNSIYLFFGILLNAIVPSLVFYALLNGNVINVIILLRFRGISFAAFGYVFFRNKIARSDLLGYIIIAIGLIVVVAGQGMAKISLADIFALVASLIDGVKGNIDAKCLKSIPSAGYLFLTNFFSAIIFFVIVMMFFGLSHFADAFKGELWIVMLLYAGVGVMMSQLLWLKGVKRVKTVIAANVTLISPIFAFFFAYLLLGDIPTITQIIALAVILCGLVIARLTSNMEFIKIHDKPSTA